MKKKFITRTNIFRGLICLGVMLLSISMLAMTILEGNSTMVDEYLGTHTTKIVTDANAQLYDKYTPDAILTNGKLDASKAEQLSTDYNISLGEEGCVLLKNDGVLPLSDVSSVTILGNYSKNYASYLKTALEKKGISVNPTAITAYNSSKNNGSLANPLNANLKAWSNKQQQYYNTTDAETLSGTQFYAHESTFAELESAKSGFKTSLNSYSDAAIIFIGRISAEGADYNASSTAVKSSSDKCRNPLAITDGEKALIESAKTYFDKIIVLVATSNMMELGYLEDNDDVNGVLYASLDSNFNNSTVDKNTIRPGIMQGIANVLTGDANPSGALSSISASNSLSSPACMNVGGYRYANASEINIYDSVASKGSNEGRVDIATTKTSATDPGYTNYLIEAEGIYTGYKYYETRYYDCVLNQGNASSTAGVYDSTGNWNYKEEVVYGFGYGLSYTNWTKEIVSVSSTIIVDNTYYADVKVKVTNSGSKAGKTSVQIYVQSPYTEYDKMYNVEKASVSLVGVDKTDIINAGESTTVTIRVDLSNVASYDYTNAKTYIMDLTGDYYFATGNGAHDALNNILACQGKTISNGMDYNGNTKGAKKWNYTSSESGAVDKVTFATSKNGTKITNQLDSANLSYYGTTNLNVTYLSRKDWEGTYPISYDGLIANSEMLKYLNGTKGNCPESTETKAQTFGKTTELKFADLADLEFDNSLWSELIASLSLEETIKFAYNGGRAFTSLSCGFTEGTYANNGNSPYNVAYNAGGTNAPWLEEGAENKDVTLSIPTLKYGMLATTFSPDLAKKCGEILGLASLISEVPITWNPGLNTLRTPYNGRAAFYMSEDSYLTGVLGLEIVESAKDYGAVMAIKHFAFNDQEFGRCGLSVYMNEQKAREGDMRAFQIPVEGGTYRDSDSTAGTMGMMLSFTKLGAIEVTCNYNLLNNILREEWGYNGYAVTDLLDDVDLGSQAFKAGTTGYDVRIQTDIDYTQFYNSTEYQTDYDLQKAIKEATKRELWVFANSNLMNKIDRSSRTAWNLTWWRLAYIIFIAVSGVIIATGLILYIISLIKSKKTVKEVQA